MTSLGLETAGPVATHLADDTAPAVRMIGVAKSFGRNRAVNGVDLTIRRGETVALLGPNGAGKSTTISMMLGLIPPDRGTIEMFGTTPAAAIARGDVGAMLQDQMFLPNATVRDFVTLARRLYPGAPSTEELLAVAGLTDVAKTKVNKLSGGEAKRARFAFAMAGRPELLVLDEPTAAMDVAGRQTFWTAMRRYAESGHAIVFATHYLEEADAYADRVVVVANGRVIADGPTAEIKKMVSGRTVAFDLLGAPIDGLSRLRGVRAVEVAGDRATLACEDADATVVELVRSGRPFANLEVVSAGLEAAFLALTTPAPEA
jgi:ABC-2 type transport system ATP-binding protein